MDKMRGKCHTLEARPRELPVVPDHLDQAPSGHHQQQQQQTDRQMGPLSSFLLSSLSRLQHGRELDIDFCINQR